MRPLSIIAAAATLLCVAPAQEPPARKPDTVPAAPLLRPPDRSAAPKQDAGSETKPMTPLDRFEAVKCEWEAARTAFSELYRAAKTPEARDAVMKDKRPDPAPYAARCWAIVAEAPKEPSAFKSLAWIASNAERSGVDQKRAHEALSRDFVDDPGYGVICRGLGYERTAWAETYLQRALDKSKNSAVRAQACLALAQQQASTASFARSVQAATDEKRIASLKSAYGDDEFARVKALDANAVAARSEKLFERVVEEWGKDPVAGTFAEDATAALFEIRNLAIGKEAPDIVGEDIFAAPMKLSDYRGKVVVIDFWGNW